LVNAHGITYNIIILIYPPSLLFNFRWDCKNSVSRVSCCVSYEEDKKWFEETKSYITHEEKTRRRQQNRRQKKNWKLNWHKILTKKKPTTTYEQMTTKLSQGIHYNK